MQLILLLVAVAAAAVVAAGESASLALRRQTDRARQARQRVAEVVEAARAYYRQTLVLPPSLGALVAAGHLRAASTADPFLPAAPLRLVREGARGTLRCWSRGPDHVDQRGAGDDLRAEAVAAVVGTACTRELGARFVHAAASRVTSVRWAGELDAENAQRFASLLASRTWLEGHTDDGGWPRRVAEHVQLAVQAVGEAATGTGRDAPALLAAVAAIAADATALAGGDTGGRSGLSAAAVTPLPLGVGCRRLLRAALLWLDDHERALRAGAVGPGAWRARVLARLPGFEVHALAALLEVQDGDCGLSHPLAAYASIRKAVAGLGLPAEAVRDGFGTRFALDPGPRYGVRSAGPDGVFGTDDDLVFAAW